MNAMQPWLAACRKLKGCGGSERGSPFSSSSPGMEVGNQQHGVVGTPIWGEDVCSQAGCCRHGHHECPTLLSRAGALSPNWVVKMGTPHDPTTRAGMEQHSPTRHQRIPAWHQHGVSAAQKEQGELQHLCTAFPCCLRTPGSVTHPAAIAALLPRS